MFTTIELFAGAGGLALGLKQMTYRKRKAGNVSEKKRKKRKTKE